MCTHSRCIHCGPSEDPDLVGSRRITRGLRASKSGVNFGDSPKIVASRLSKSGEAPASSRITAVAQPSPRLCAGSTGARDTLQPPKLPRLDDASFSSQDHVLPSIISRSGTTGPSTQRAPKASREPEGEAAPSSGSGVIRPFARRFAASSTPQNRAPGMMLSTAPSSYRQSDPLPSRSGTERSSFQSYLPADLPRRIPPAEASTPRSTPAPVDLQAYLKMESTSGTFERLPTSNPGLEPSGHNPDLEMKWGRRKRRTHGLSYKDT